MNTFNFSEFAAPVGSAMQRFAGLSNDEQGMLDEADRFARKELYPLSQRMDKEECGLKTPSM